MKIFSSLILFIFCVNISFGQNPQPKKITKKFFPDVDTLQNVTPALQKKRGFTDYEELIQFLTSLENSHPEIVKLSYIGESQNEYKIPILHIIKSSEKE